MSDNLKPIVINEGGLINDERSIRYYLKSILGNESEGIINILIDYINSQQPSTPWKLTVEDVLVISSKYISELLNNPYSPIAPRISLEVLEKLVEEINSFEIVAKIRKKEFSNYSSICSWYQLSEYVPSILKESLVNQSTPIGVAGNCLASEFAYNLQKENYNFIVSEPAGPMWSLGSDLPIAPARWGLITNTAAFYQLAEFAFGLRNRPNVIWTHIVDGKRINLDPFRMHQIVEDPNKYTEYLEIHRKACREAFKQCEVFLFIPSTAETWWLKEDDSVLGHLPFNISYALLRPKILSHNENVDYLQKSIGLIRQHNTGMKFILGISPTPIEATVAPYKQSVAEANLLTKSTLRLAIQDIIDSNDGVYYFPCYENTLYCTDNPYRDDKIHLTDETVGKIWELFLKLFCN